MEEVTTFYINKDTSSKGNLPSFSGDQEALADQSLELHNSFEILDNENDKDSGADPAEIRDNLVVPFGMREAVGAISNNILDEGAVSVSPINLEVSSSSQARPSDITGSNNDQQMKLNDGRWSFPGVMPTTSIRVMDLDKLKVWVDTPVFTPMLQPITTKYASLTSDKLPSSQTLVSASKSSIHFVAVLKSVQILSKFSGNEVEEEMEDTLRHDNAEATISDFEQHYPSFSKSTKAKRKKKKQVNKEKPANFNSAGMRTRAQKSTFKAALADTE